MEDSEKEKKLSTKFNVNCFTPPIDWVAKVTWFSYSYFSFQRSQVSPKLLIKAFKSQKN